MTLCFFGQLSQQDILVQPVFFSYRSCIYTHTYAHKKISESHWQICRSMYHTNSSQNMSVTYIPHYNTVTIATMYPEFSRQSRLIIFFFSIGRIGILMFFKLCLMIFDSEIVMHIKLERKNYLTEGCCENYRSCPVQVLRWEVSVASLSSWWAYMGTGSVHMENDRQDCKVPKEIIVSHITSAAEESQTGVKRNFLQRFMVQSFPWNQWKGLKFWTPNQLCSKTYIYRGMCFHINNQVLKEKKKIPPEDPCINSNTQYLKFTSEYVLVIMRIFFLKYINNNNSKQYFCSRHGAKRVVCYLV